MKENASTDSIGFLNSLYRYHTNSGLNISALSDDEWCREMAYLELIREQEQQLTISKQLNTLLG